VKSVDGSTLTVTQSDGTTRTVTTSPSTQITVLKPTTLDGLATGQPVLVAGPTNSDGTVRATTVLEGAGGMGLGFGRRGAGRRGGTPGGPAPGGAGQAPEDQ
jgi:hypothetical protein